MRMWTSKFGWMAVALAGILLTAARPALAADSIDDLLNRASQQVSAFLDQFSNVKCTEHVEQDKLNKDGKIELKEESTYDYLVILTNPGGELTLDESRIPVHEAKADKKNRAMLVSNGFATLFLVFHPYYLNSFEFRDEGEAQVDGRTLRRIGFQHKRGTRSPAALALRGREYPLELSGSALLEPQTAAIVRIEAGVANTMEDVGLKVLQSEMDYAPVRFNDVKATYWFPSQAMVEVETLHQHWRNTHRFTDYKQFSVSTEEQVANK